MNYRWQTYKLDEVLEIVMGQSPVGSSCNQEGVGVPLLNGPTEFGSWNPVPAQYTVDPKKIAEVNDLLFCVRGSTTGRMNWADQKYAIGRGLAAIRHKSGYEYQPFVRAVMEIALKTLLNETTGSTFPNLSKDQLNKFEINLPDLPTQRRIAEILSALDDKIELNRRMNQTLEQMAQTLFRQYFVEGIDEDNLPEGWKWGKLKNVSKNLRKSVTPGEMGEDINYVGLEHIPRRTIALYDWASSEGVESNKYRFEKDQILFGKLRPYFHKVVLAPLEGVCSTDILVIEPIKDYMLSFCLLHYSSKEVVEYSNMLSSGTRMPRADWKGLSEYEIAIPPSDVLISFHKQITPLLSKIKLNIREIKTLAKTRDTLLPKLMSGEIDVMQDQKQYEPVLS